MEKVKYVNDMEFAKNRYKYAVLVIAKKYYELLGFYLKKSINVPTKDLRTSKTYCAKFLNCFQVMLNQKQLKKAVNIPAREYDNKYKKVLQEEKIITEDQISKLDYDCLPHLSYYINFIDEKKESCKLTKEQLKYARHFVSSYMRYQNMWENTVR